MSHWLSEKYKKYLSTNRGFTARNQRSTWFVLILTFLLIPLLAVLQYIWLGQLSEAEKVRMEANLKLSVERYAEDFDNELTKIYSTFRQANILSMPMPETLDDAFQRYNAQNPIPGLIKNVYSVQLDSNGVSLLKLFDQQEKKLITTDWPAELNKLKNQISENNLVYLQALISMSHAPVLDDQPYIIIHNIPNVLKNFMDKRTDSFLIIVLNQSVLKEKLLPALDQRYFYADSIPLYQTAIIKADSNHTVFYKSGSAKVDVFAKQSDQSTQIGNWRTGEIMIATANISAKDSLHHNADKALKLKTDKRFSIEMVRRDSFARKESFNFIVARTIPWRLHVRHIHGSLDSVVQQSHTRNLIISYLILLLLGISMVFILYATRKAQKAARQQIEFVAGLTHELRTPLATIRSAAENIKDGVVKSTASLKDYGRLIYNEDLRLTNMIEQALQFAGISNGIQKPEKKSLNIFETINAICKEFQPDNRQLIENKVKNDLYVLIHPYSFKVVLRNLISNALKYNPQNKPLVIESEINENSHLVYLHFHDQGCGINEDELNEIFKPFFRGQFAKDKQIQGSGIGLSLVQKIIAEHDGQIRVKSKPGRGSTFSLVLPYARSAGDV